MIQGQLERLHLGDLLQWLQLGELTGRLRLTASGVDRHLDLLGGRVVFVSSTDPAERLGTWLAAEELLPPDRIRGLLGASMLRRQRFTELLVEHGPVERSALHASLARLAEAVVLRVLGAPSVRFALDPAYPVGELLGVDLALDPTSLVMEASRRVDDREPAIEDPGAPLLPFTGEAFEDLFWSLVAEAVPPDEPVDGHRLTELRALLRTIVGTLSEWLASSPGLVPIPTGQAAWIAERAGHPGPAIDCTGLPHATWNQMVLAHAVRSDGLTRPIGLSELSKVAAELDLWLEMTGSERWRRPHADRLDTLTTNVAETWARGAAAAGLELEVDSDLVSLAIHLLVVPVDLVLWVLGTVPVPHRALRRTLVQRLPERLGLGLARLADLPDDIHGLFTTADPTPLAIAVHLAREQLPSAHVWPRTVPDDAGVLLDAVPAAVLTRAAAAAREAMRDRPEHLDAAVG